MIINTDSSGLTVELHGPEQVWALRAKVSVPKESIKSVRYEPIFNDWRKWEVRVPGTAVPRVLMAGSYWTEEGWDFLYIKRPRGLVKPFAENVLVVETDLPRYTRLILSMDESEAKKAVNWWNRAGKAKAKA